jgi:hypothetical protein
MKRPGSLVPGATQGRWSVRHSTIRRHVADLAALAIAICLLAILAVYFFR